MTDTILGDEIQDIINRICTLGSSVIHALQNAVEALNKHQKEEAKKILDYDNKIDAECIKIETTCFNLLATKQPVAGDLRAIISCMQIIPELERIGDHTKYLANAIKYSSKPLTDRLFKNLSKMSKQNCTMLSDGLIALRNRDEYLAIEVAQKDNRIDTMHWNIHKQIITIMKNEPEKIEESVILLFLIRYLERIGDHVTNICEWIVYAKNGKRVELNG